LDKYYEICKNFEKETLLQLEYAEYSKMVINNVNNYLAVYTNGKVKRKGDMFEIYEDFVNMKAYHKNPSFLIIPLALQEYFVRGVDYRTFIKNHDNIFDFCAGIKKKSNFEFVWLENGELKYGQKVTRYFVSKNGTYLVKRYADGRESKVESGWKTTVLNKIVDTNAQNYKIDHTYYIKAVEKIVFEIEGNSNQLSLL